MLTPPRPASAARSDCVQEWDALSIFNNIQLLFLYGALSYHFVIVQNHLHLDPRDANANNNANTNANTNWNGGDRPSRLARLFQRDRPLRAALNLICLLCGGLVFGSMSSVPALQSSLGTGSNLSSTQTAVYFWLGVVVVAVVVWHLWYACAHLAHAGRTSACTSSPGVPSSLSSPSRYVGVGL